MTDSTGSPKASKISNRYWLLTRSGQQVDDATRVILDTNILIDLRSWFEGSHQQHEELHELLTVLREIGKRGRRATGLREVGIPITFPALIEATWAHGGQVDREQAVRYLAYAFELSTWDTSTFKNRIGPKWTGSAKPISREADAWAQAKLSNLDLDDYAQEFAGDWASVLFLLPFLPRAETLKSPKARLNLRKEWTDFRHERGVSCTAEVKMLAEFIFFGGTQAVSQGPGATTYLARDLFKQKDWLKDGLSHVSRNIAFDLKMLHLWRESATSNPAAIGPQPTVLATGDQGLAAVHSLVLGIHGDPERSSEPSTEPIGGLIAATPKGSMFEKWLSALPEVKALEMRMPDSNSFKPHLNGRQVLESIPEWVEEAEDTLGIRRG